MTNAITSRGAVQAPSGSVQLNTKNAHGLIKLYIGCMFASKSTTMMRDIERYTIAGKKCLVIKYAKDIRYDHLSKLGGIVCHDEVEYKSNIISSETLGHVDITNYDVIGISEGQFFNDLLLCDEWANKNKIIIVEGLDGDHQRANFGHIAELIPKCEKVLKLHAICLCGRNASFTKKISGDQNEQNDIGGREKYMPVCRNCYL
jgi:thymidine kinase